MMNLFDLTGKKAIVTGASRGLGRAIAEGYMKSGAETVLVASGAAAAEEAAAGYREKGFKCHAVAADLRDEAARSAGFEKALALLGGHLDILVNCAGAMRRCKSEDYSLEDWNLLIDVNLTATFRMCQLAGKVMLAQGSGKIINIASMLSFFGGFIVPAYAASKGGVAQLTKALCNEWAGRGVNVNAIAPGYMATEMTAALSDPSSPRYHEIVDRIPAHRWGTPEDLQGPAVFLASAASDYLNGAIIPVDGSYLVR